MSSKKGKGGVRSIDILKAFLIGPPPRKYDAFEIFSISYRVNLAIEKAYEGLEDNERFFEANEKLCKLEELRDALPLGLTRDRVQIEVDIMTKEVIRLGNK